jgi:hypothetical protein
MNATTAPTAPRVNLAIAVGDLTKVHAADCADLKKAPAKRAAYNGIHTQSFPAGTDERDVWLDYNDDFLAEGGAEAAWPLTFLPCCAGAGLAPNADRTYGEADEAPAAEVAPAVAADKAVRNAAVIAARAAGTRAVDIAAVWGIHESTVNDILRAARKAA